MVRLCYESLAKYLVEVKSYPSSLVDEFTKEEEGMLSKHQIVDLVEFNVKFIDGQGAIAAQLESIRFYEFQTPFFYFKNLVVV